MLTAPELGGVVVLFPDARVARRVPSKAGAPQHGRGSPKKGSPRAPLLPEGPKTVVSVPDVLEDSAQGTRKINGADASCRRQVFRFPYVPEYARAAYEYQVEKCTDSEGRIVFEDKFDGLQSKRTTSTHLYLDSESLSPDMFAVPEGYTYMDPIPVK